MATADTRVALVTGASGTIGNSIARALDSAGFRVALQHRGSSDAVDQLCAELTNTSAMYQFDVTDWDAVQVAEEQLRSEMGPVAVLVNAAGLRLDGPMVAQSVEDWRSVIDVNLIGSFHTTRAVLMGMLGSRFGRIVNIISPAGLVGNAGQTSYAAAKAGVVGMTKSLAKEYGRKGITANAVSPGFVRSRMTASLPETVVERLIDSSTIGRPIDPDWVADGVVYLARSTGVNGHVLAIDGGMAL